MNSENLESGEPEYITRQIVISGDRGFWSLDLGATEHSHWNRSVTYGWEVIALVLILLLSFVSLFYRISQMIEHYRQIL